MRTSFRNANKITLFAFALAVHGIMTAQNSTTEVQRQYTERNLSKSLYDSLPQQPNSLQNPNETKVGENSTAVGFTSRSNTKCSMVTTWNGFSWDPFLPDNVNTKIIFKADYDSSTDAYPSQGITGCILEINPRVNVVLSFDHSMTIQNEVQIGRGGNLILKNNAALVQIKENNLNIGSIQVERNFHFSPERNQYNFVSSPVINQNLKKIYKGDNKVQYYNEADNKFIFYDGTYEAGRGIAIREASFADEPQSATTAQFTGVPFNGTLTLSGLTNSKTGFHLIGNPYPSPLDLNVLYNENPDLEARFLFWDNRGNPHIVQQGDAYQGQHYAQYNAINSTGTAAVGVDSLVYAKKVPNGKVPVGSAVMARLIKEVTTGKVTLNNTQRTIQNGISFFGKNNLTEKDRYWLTMQTPGNLAIMNAVVYFEGGNDDYGMDDNQSMGGSDDFYSLVPPYKLAIQGKAPFVDTDTIKLGYNAYQSGFYKINLYNKEGVFANGQNIYLIDLENESTHNLSEDGDYTFESEAGEYLERFIIVYRPEETEEPEESLSNSEITQKELFVYKQGNQTVINSLNSKISSLKIFNIKGQLLLNQNEIHSNSYRFDNAFFGKQVLLLKIRTNDKEEHNIKISTH